MSERGEFLFRRYCVRGASKWIEACRTDGGGFVVLWVGRPGRSEEIPNLRRRPYRIVGKVGEKKRQRKARKQT